jgi:hypothetical protein
MDQFFDSLSGNSGIERGEDEVFFNFFQFCKMSFFLSNKTPRGFIDSINLVGITDIGVTLAY